MKEYNIYRIESEDEIDWIHAEGNLLEVLKWYTDEYVVNLKDIDTITLLPKEEWKNRNVVIQDPDGEEDIVETFFEYCQGMNCNEVIASSRWE